MDQTETGTVVSVAREEAVWEELEDEEIWVTASTGKEGLSAVRWEAVARVMEALVKAKVAMGLGKLEVVVAVLEVREVAAVGWVELVERVEVAAVAVLPPGRH